MLIEKLRKKVLCTSFFTNADCCAQVCPPNLPALTAHQQ